MPDVKPIIHVTFCGAEGAFIVGLVFFGFVRSANYRAIVVFPGIDSSRRIRPGIIDETQGHVWSFLYKENRKNQR
jgi:hypothetical protein